MIQNASKADMGIVPMHSRPVLIRIAKAILAGSTSAFALLVPFESRADWQVTTRYHDSGKTTTYRRIRPTNFAITTLPDGPAPANDCPGSAFEVLNPKHGEARCIGYVSSGRRR